MLCKIVQMKGTVGIFAQPAPSLYGLGDCDMEEGIQSDLPKVTQFMEETKVKPPSTLEGAMETIGTMSGWTLRTKSWRILKASLGA